MATVQHNNVLYTRKVLEKEITGAQLLAALRRENLAGGVQFVPRRLESSEWKRCKDTVISLTQSNSDNQRFCVAHFDQHCIVRKFVSPEAVFPRGAVIYALRG